MKNTQAAALLAALVARVVAEVPQEQSHRQFLLTTQTFLQLNNRFNIVDPVFGLLGNAAAADGAGDVENLDCLQQITADEAFTNAKDAGDIDGMANALIFRAIERNTGSVGLASVLCDEDAVNAEIQALSQHQDPASDNAQQINKDIVLALAVQLALIGADPTLALLSGTFLPGDVNDPTGAGNTCNEEDDAVGCIFTQNLIIADASIDEINAAVADVMGADAPTVNEVMAENLDVLATMMASGQLSAAVDDAATADAATADAEVSASAEEATGTVNVQTFAGNLGGAAPAVISSAAERPFEVNGATFLNAGAAIQRSCAVQNNACANAANSGQIDGGVAACNEQEQACRAQADLKIKRQNGATATVNVQSFAGNLGGAAPAVISSAAERPFEVNGATFLNAGAAIQRSCAVQNNACANAANSGQIEGGVAACNQQEQACRAQGAVAKRFIKNRQNGALDFGACSNPGIQFAVGLDGRADAAFGPANKADFSQGSAFNINIVSSFICQRLGDSCDAPEDTVAACENGAAAASGLEGDAAAQAFNSALGL